MISVQESIGYIIIGGALLQCLLMVFGTLRRQRQESWRTQKSTQLYREKNQLALEIARAERDREVLSWNGIRKFRIARLVQEANDIKSFYFTPHDQRPLPTFLPGQYLTFNFHVPGQPKGVVRCYSLSDTPLETDHYRISVKHIREHGDKPAGVVSSHLHTNLGEGSIVDVRAPSGNFYLDIEENRPVVLIAGGIGFTPMYSMFETLCRMPTMPETWFFYGLRNKHEHLMPDHLRARASERDAAHLVVCYSDPTEECIEGKDYDVHGRVSVDLFREKLKSSNYVFFMCGPPPMMQAVSEGLLEWGVPKEDIRSEAFGPASIPSASKKAVSGGEGAETLEVVFNRSDKICQWTESSGTILEFAEANGIAMDFGCRAGNCGTCATAIREGEVTMLSEPGAETGEGSCLACIACPASKLVLEA